MRERGVMTILMTLSAVVVDCVEIGRAVRGTLHVVIDCADVSLNTCSGHHKFCCE